jgi:hypothetical protein
MRRMVRRAVPVPEAGGGVTFLAAALPLLGVYLLTMQRGLPAGDSGELIAAAATFGVAHPPGYPLYVLLAGAWLRLVPLGSPAFRLDLLSALAMAAAAGVLALAVTRLGARRAAGVLAAWAFGLCAPAWKYALVAEVFALHALLGSLALLALALAAGGGRERASLLALLALGSLALSHHQTLLLLALPCSLATLPLAWRAAGRRRPALARDAALALLLALAPLAWLPLGTPRAGAQVWGEADTWRGFAAMLLRSDYGTLRLDPLQSGMHADRSHVLIWLGSLPRGFGLLPLGLALAGAVYAWRTHRRLALALVGFLLLQALFFTRVGFPSGSRLLRGVVERFYVLPALALALLAGLGAAWLLARLPRRAEPAAGALLAALVAGTALGARFRTVDQRGDTLCESLGRGMLASLPPHAVLFVRGDVPHNALSYLIKAEGLRPDVTVVDQELMTYGWYLRRLRERDPALLPPFAHAERIRLRDGRRLEGVAIPRGDGTIDVLAESTHATLPRSAVLAVEPASSESLYAATRAHFTRGLAEEHSDDRYSGLPGTRNLLWFDHLAGRRPAAITAPREQSFVLRYSLTPVGFVDWVRPRGREPGVAEQADAALAVLDTVPLDPYFRAYDPESFEFAERGRFAAFAARAALVLCQPGAAAAIREHPAGAARLRAFAARFEALETVRDPACLRAIGFLRVFDPAFRELGWARSDLERWLASGDPATAQDQEARRLLEQLRAGARP